MSASIGLLARLGFTWYYAEAMPAFLWFLLGIVLTVRGPFPAIVKLGLLFSIAFLLRVGGPLGDFGFNIFGTRPEGHVEAAWLTGLILLESGRLEKWRKSKLFAGAFALAWASGVHYYAVAAGLGVAVYMIAAVRRLGWRKAMPAGRGDGRGSVPVRPSLSVSVPAAEPQADRGSRTAAAGWWWRVPVPRNPLEHLPGMGAKRRD